MSLYTLINTSSYTTRTTNMYNTEFTYCSFNRQARIFVANHVMNFEVEESSFELGRLLCRSISLSTS